jgi:hypothetical protein
VLVDRVMATVSDAVILYREIATLTQGDARGREAELGRPLTRDERWQLERQYLAQKIDQHALAQAAKTIGILPPEQVEALFQEELEQDEREQIRDFGTYQRYSQELERVGRTWETYEREQRVSKMADLMRQMAVTSRLQNQRNLFITPRMMRDYYRRIVDLFVHGSSGSVAAVACLGADRAAVAKELIAAWQLENVTAGEIATRFAARGVVKVGEFTRLTAEARTKVRADLVDFALAGPFGRVSEPVPVGDGPQQALQIWKVVEFLPAREGRFEDPEVQAEIRTRLESLVWVGLMRQTVERARDRTEPWYPPVLVRRDER